MAKQKPPGDKPEPKIQDTEPWGPDPNRIPPPIITGPAASGFPNAKRPGDQGTVDPNYQPDSSGNKTTDTTTGGGSDGGSDGGADPSADWATAFFGSLGLPPDVMNQVTTILRQHAEDQALAQALATQYIRSTDWYQIHYPGALEGLANGTIQSEAQYTDYLRQINILSRQYQGRDISGDEIKGYLKAGYDPGYVGRLFQGQAFVTANRNDIQYQLGAFGNGRLDDKSLAALGNETAGIDTALGQNLQNQLQQATRRLQTIFQGTLARPSMSLGGNGVVQPTLAGTRPLNGNGSPDVQS